MYLFLALVLFWSFVLIQIVGGIHRLSNSRHRYRIEEAERLIGESPYFQHLGLRPPKPIVPIRMWAIAFAIWCFGVYFLSTLNIYFDY